MQDTKRVKNPGKQRKKIFNAPAHLRHKLMSSPLSSELAASRGAKTLPVRKGDTVRIQRGDNKGFEGKVSRVDTRSYRIYIEGFTREKVDGTNIFLPVHPSKVEIRNLNLDDKWRKNILARKQEIGKPAKKAKAKARPTKKVEIAPEQPQANVEEIQEEKPVEAPPIEIEPIEEKTGAPEIEAEAPAEEAPAEIVPEVVAEEAVEEAPVAKKAAVKKPAAKKSAGKKAPAKKKPAEEEAHAEEGKAPAKKAAKPKVAAKKAAASKEAPAKEAASKKTASKSSAKHKTAKETEGGQ
jgi:large subunit ribosomal protein L24